MEKEDIEIVKDIVRNTMSNYRIEEMEERSEATVLYICMIGIFITGVFIGLILRGVW
jgi:hypothetical protein